MKFVINTTIKPVGFDYALALHALGFLTRLHSAFPAIKSREEAKKLDGKVSYHDGIQIVYLMLKRLIGESRLFRFIGHLSVIYLDYRTSVNLNGADVCLFQSGAGLRTLRACKRSNVLSVCQVHHAYTLEQQAILKEEAQLAGARFVPLMSSRQVKRKLDEFQEVDAILCPSQQVKRSFERAGFPKRKLIVVPHGVSLKALPDDSPKRQSAANKFTLLFVGQMHYRKGLRYLYDALELLDDHNIELRLVGPDFGAYKLPENNSPSSVKIVGIKKGAELVQEYAAADVFVLPSVEEGFGLVVLEAMAMSLPVVVSEAVGATDYIQDGVQGFVIPMRDAKALADRIKWLKEHPEERMQLGANGRATTGDLKGWEASASLLVRELEKIRKA